MADEKKDDELTPVGPGADLDTTEEDIRQGGDDDQDESQSETEARGGDDSDDERPGHSEGDDDRKTRRREERHRRRQRQDEAIKRDKLELNFLRGRNEALERRQSEQDLRISQTEVVTIDGRIAQIDDQLRQAEDLKAQAIKSGDGSSAVEADRIIAAFAGEKQKLEGLKGQAINGARTRAAQGRQPNVDPEVARRARSWISENSDWFDPNLGDDDSAIAKTIEDRLFREGRLDPRDDSYWEEYERRLEKRLPHVFEKSTERDESRSNGNGNGTRRNGGPRMTTGGRERALRKNEVFISAERRRALEEAGVWDDPKLRERYLRRYQQFDVEAARERNRH